MKRYLFKIVLILLLFSSCEKRVDNAAPTVETLFPTLQDAIHVTFIGNVTDEAGNAVTDRGFCWGLEANPTVNDSFSSNEFGTGLFTYEVILNPNITYFVRAYAVNARGTVYGKSMSFNTGITLPEVTTSLIISVKSNSALSGVNVISDGGENISAQGVCWSKYEKPTIANGLSNNGLNLYFESILSNLSPNTTYHVRAYATNKLGTNYGNEIDFKTRDKNVLVTDGDSRTAGWNCSSLYPYFKMLNLNESFKYYNMAVGV